MPFQNRVSPFGDIAVTTARGTLMGNRGCLHDNQDHPVRQYQGRRWIICVLDFKGRTRKPMPPGHYTSLFFLDEATALAAGHRPCFFCRRGDALRFCAAWEQGNGVTNVRAPDIDAVLHRERLEAGEKRLHALPVPLGKLPGGAMVQEGAASYLIAQGRALAWSPAGYRAADITALRHAMLLTPPSALRALSAGYRPLLHPSALG